MSLVDFSSYIYYLVVPTYLACLTENEVWRVGCRERLFALYSIRMMLNHKCSNITYNQILSHCYKI